jgi:putative flippase GtrA
MHETAGQAARYLVGAVIALAVDASIVSVGVALGAPVALARLLALLAGITTTYVFNRRFTFTPLQPASLQNWREYVMAQAVGSLLNFAISTVLLYAADRTLWKIWGSVLVGAAVGFCVNFLSARRVLHDSRKRS